MNLLAAKIALIFLVGIGTFLASLFPWIAATKLSSRRALDVISVACALSAGIVLGALLCHLLPEASESYSDFLTDRYGEDDRISGFPFAGLTCGLVLSMLVSIDAVIVRRGFEEVVAPHELEQGEHAHGVDHITASLQRLAAQQQQEQLQHLQNGGVVAVSDAETLPLRLAIQGARSRSASTAHSQESPSSAPASSNSAAVTTTANGLIVAAPPGIERKKSGGRRMASIEVEKDDGFRDGCKRHHALGMASCEDCYVAVPNDSPSRSTVGKARAFDSNGNGGFGAAESRPGPAVILQANATPSSGSVPQQPAKRGDSPLVAAYKRSQERKLILRAWVFFLALSLHGVFDGLSVASEQDAQGFTSTLVAVLSHKLFDGLSLGCAIYPASAHLPAIQKWLLLIVSACSTPLGIGLGIAAVSLASGDNDDLKMVNAVALSLASGSFLYISLLELLPSSLSDGRLIITKLLFFVAGFLAMAGLAYFV